MTRAETEALLWAASLAIKTGDDAAAEAAIMQLLAAALCDLHAIAASLEKLANPLGCLKGPTG